MSRSLAFSIASLLMLFVAACAPEQHDSKECRKISVTFYESISIGDSQEKLVRFYETKRWKYNYDNSLNGYFTKFTIQREGELVVHAVIVAVYIGDTGKVAKVVIQDAYK